MSIIEYATSSPFKISSPKPSRTELTLREAADVLGVPESDLVELLDTGEIESRFAGNRRVVISDSLFDYNRETTRLQNEALDELTQQTQDWGLD